jgi:hypothetical protein
LHCLPCSFTAPRSARKKRIFTSLTQLMEMEQQQQQQQAQEQQAAAEAGARSQTA